MLLLSVIIVSFNTRELTLDCLEKLLKECFRCRDKFEAEIIIIDNGSSDGSVSAIESKHQNDRRVKIISNRENHGFARANNQGLRVAKGDYFLLLNSDVLVADSSIEKMVVFAREYEDKIIVAPRLLNKDRTVQASVFRFPTILGAIGEYWFGEKGAYEKYTPKEDFPIEVEVVVGAAMLIPRAILQKLGLFDEQYFMYFEDFDYCRRARKMGIKVFYCPQITLFHRHGASGKTIPEKTTGWLKESSKKYHGWLKYVFLTAVIWLGQKLRK